MVPLGQENNDVSADGWWGRQVRRELTTGHTGTDLPHEGEGSTLTTLIVCRHVESTGHNLRHKLVGLWGHTLREGVVVPPFLR